MDEEDAAGAICAACRGGSLSYDEEEEIDDDDEVEEEDLEPGMKIWYGEWGCELCPTITGQEKPPSKPP